MLPFWPANRHIYASSGSVIKEGVFSADHHNSCPPYACWPQINRRPCYCIVKRQVAQGDRGASYHKLCCVIYAHLRSCKRLLHMTCCVPIKCVCQAHRYRKSRQALRHDITEFRLQGPHEHRQHPLSASASGCDACMMSSVVAIVMTGNHNSKSI